MKFHIVVITAILAPLVIAAPSTAQSSFRQLSPGRSILGLNLSTFADSEIIGGSLQYAMDPNTTAIFALGIGFVEETEAISHPPAPAAGAMLGKTGSLGETGLGYFSYIAFEVDAVRSILKPNNWLQSTTLRFGPSVKGGVFKSLKFSERIVTYPFFGLSYTYLWTATGINDQRLDFRNPGREGSFSGMLGMEVKLSPRFGVFGVLDFSFEQSEASSTIGINFF